MESNDYSQRQALVDLPCTTETEIQSYREHIQQLILQRTSIPATKLPIEPHPAWLDSSTVPPSLQEKAQEIGVTLTPQHWAALTPLQRFALIKLSRPGHESKNFPIAIENLICFNYRIKVFSALHFVNLPL